MKIFGAGLLVLMSYFCGRTIACNEGRPLAETESLVSLMRYIRRRIASERIPLFSLFASYEDRVLTECGFLKIMRSCRGSPKEQWVLAVETLSIGKDIERELLFFGNELGELSLEDQIKRLDSVIESLENEKSKLKELLPPKQKSTKTVWLLCGILTAIVLL